MLMEPALPPYSLAEAALFLDFDGTLVPIAATPDSIVVPPQLIPLLQDLQSLLGGALAIISGREIAALDQFTAPLRIACAGAHGAQRRDALGRQFELRPGDVTAVTEVCRQLAAEHPALFVEPKQSGVALHYRCDPALEPLCLRTMEALSANLPQWVLLRGKFVLEMLPMGASKGQAISAFMQEPPFAGRLPIFVGDDLSDESGFSAVQAQCGIAIKVGPGTTAARHRLESVQAVYEWLQTACAQLKRLNTPTEVSP